MKVQICLLNCMAGWPSTFSLGIDSAEVGCMHIITKTEKNCVRRIEQKIAEDPTISLLST